MNESGYKFTVLGDEADPLRARRDPQRRPRRDRLDPRRAARERRSRRFFDLCERVDLRAVQQARVRGADRVRRARRARRPSRAVLVGARHRDAGGVAQAAGSRRCGQVSLFGLAADRTSGDRRTQPRVLPNIAPMARSRAAHEGEGDPRLLHLAGIRSSRSASSASCSRRTPCRQLGQWTRRADVARRGRHGDQAADQQAVGRRVRAVDSRGFFGIFRGPGLPGELGGCWPTGSGPTCRCC